MSRLVYVFDDEESICELMRIALESRGYKVKTANDGVEGLAMIKQEKPDLIIVSIKLPKLNGYELVSELKMNADYSDIPIIVITSLTSESTRSDEEWKESLGVQDFISKPFEPLTLIKRIESILGDYKHASSHQE